MSGLYRHAAVLAVSLSIFLLTACSSEAGAAENGAIELPREPGACQVGTYQSRDGDLVVLRRHHSGFRYLFLDGRRGGVDAVDSPVRCEHDRVLFESGGRAVATFARIRFRETTTRFERDGTMLFGRLIEPADGSIRRPLAVVAHGSENTAMASGDGEEPWPAFVNFLPAQGVSVFIFDKRGTGESGGTFNMNFHTLAADLTAAAAEARRLATGRYSRFGYIGLSQGGWVAPLAAQQSNPDFLLVGYGALYSPAEEAGEEIRVQLEESGYGEETLARARRLTDALAVVRASNGERGLEELIRVRREYRNEPWFEVIEKRSDWSGTLLRSNERNLRRGIGNALGIPFGHTGMDVARSLMVPQLWILAEEDRIAPIRLNLERLPQLQAEGVPIRMATFPRTDHGMIEFVRGEAGERVYTRFADGYFRLLADWAKGSLEPPYGDATFR